MTQRLTDDQLREERIAFEKWASHDYEDVSRGEDGTYRYDELDAAWKAWLHRASDLQEARAEIERLRPSIIFEIGRRFIAYVDECGK